MISGISIIICCFNSASRIEETLRHVFSLSVPENLSCEILLVNNRSTDNTKEVASNTYEHCRNIRLPFKIVDEPQPGLSFARARGIKESKNDIIIFCDDDNHVARDYLVQASLILEKYPEVGIIGGLVKPKFSVKTDRWLEDLYPALAIGPQAPMEGFVSWVYGAGMVVRRKVFLDLSNRNVELILSDRVGSKQTSGGDSEICLLAAYLGYKIYYSPKLELFHAIASHRLTQESFIKANYRNVYPVVYLYLLQSLIADRASNVNGLYLTFWKKSIGNVLYFIPRWLFGKHRFYSFILLYQNVQLTFWMLLYRTRFCETFLRIKRNLT